VLVGAGALVGAALAYFFLRSGLGLGGGGHGGTSPSDGGASPNPPGLVQTTAPAQPASLPTASLTDAVATTAPAAPLHLTVVDETYRLGPADGKPLSLDEAVGLAKSAKPGSPVTVDSIDSSRQRAKDQLRTALEQLQINIIWTRDGKPVPGDLALPGKPGQSGDGEAPR
jgi:hypothetical protein